MFLPKYEDKLGQLQANADDREALKDQLIAGIPVLVSLAKATRAWREAILRERIAARKVDAERTDEARMAHYLAISQVGTCIAEVDRLLGQVF